MTDTPETPKPKLTLKQLDARIQKQREDIKEVATSVHDLTKLLMQDHTVPALTAHRGKWKKVLQKLEAIIIQQEEVDA